MTSNATSPRSASARSVSSEFDLNRAEALVESLPASLTSPKLPKNSTGPAYRYYAGFSDAFVRELLQAATLGPDDYVLDVWNGSGTTTKIAAELGLKAVGLDLNPAMVVVAKARLLATTDILAANQVLGGLLAHSAAPALAEDDPLSCWFDLESVRMVRRAELGLRGPPPSAGWGPPDVNEMSTVSAHLYVALFLAIRGLLRRFRSSNPTWIRIPREITDRVTITYEDLCSRISEAAKSLQAEVLSRKTPWTDIDVLLSSSESLPVNLRKASLCLTSPPYCTRIDYAVATRPELAILGVTLSDQMALRRQMLGTPTVPKQLDPRTKSLGEMATQLLAKVESHPAKASKTYYWKWLAQYLEGYRTSLVELSNRMEPSGCLVLVVQGSHYKDIPIDLPQITEELLNLCGWKKLKSYSFYVGATMSGVNHHARQYRSDHSATEQVIVFRNAATTPSTSGHE